MKKTLIALMAMAGAAFGADYTSETIWTLDFGSEYTNGFQWTGKEGYSYGTPWDIVAVEGGSQTSGSKRVHMAGGTFGSWDTDFVFTMEVTLGDPISASNEWPVFGEIAGSGTALRFGPYTGNNNTVALDGNLTKDDSKNNLVSVASGGTYTINEVVHSASWSVLTPAPAVPEPTTATLSLLALAGLAARRRRK